MLLLVFGLIFINLEFFVLFSLASISMANVEGVAGPWVAIFAFFWVCFHTPYFFYLTVFLRNRRNKENIAGLIHIIRSSAWLVFPGAIMVWVLMGSGRIVITSLIFPLIQLIISVMLYKRYISYRVGNA